MINDLSQNDFEKLANNFTKYISDYLENISEKDVLPQIKPGWLKSQFSEFPPTQGESLENILKEIDEKIIPAMTHWNHPKFMAYFNSTASSAGVLGEYLAAAFNTNAMVWKSSPASTELEEAMLLWYKNLLGLPYFFDAIIYDTASISSLHAIACAREKAYPQIIRNEGLSGNSKIPKMRIYVSEEAHSSIEKSAITLGIGIQNVRKIPTDNNFSMIPKELQKAIEEDRNNGFLPIAVVATVGTTSTTSIDPVDKIGEITQKENIWLHIDAAYGGSALVTSEMQYIKNGWEFADSIVINPHKWMFIPIDLSVLFIRDKKILKQAFSIIPEYLKTEVDDIATNFMDYGIQLGRRFRSLKLWFTIKYYGKSGLERIISNHLQLAKKLKKIIEQDERFEILAPVHFSTLCFRAKNPYNENKITTNQFNQELIDLINNTKKVFLSHTNVKNQFMIRIVISGLKTTENDVFEVWEIIKEEYNKLLIKYTL